MNMDLESGTFMDWRKRGFSPEFERLPASGRAPSRGGGFPTLSESEFARAAGSNRSSRLYVERGLAEGLRGELERRWQSNGYSRRPDLGRHTGFTRSGGVSPFCQLEPCGRELAQVLGLPGERQHVDLKVHRYYRIGRLRASSSSTTRRCDSLVTG